MPDTIGSSPATSSVLLRSNPQARRRPARAGANPWISREFCDSGGRRRTPRKSRGCVTYRSLRCNMRARSRQAANGWVLRFPPGVQAAGRGSPISIVNPPSGSLRRPCDFASRPRAMAGRTSSGVPPCGSGQLSPASALTSAVRLAAGGMLHFAMRQASSTADLPSGRRWRRLDRAAARLPAVPSGRLNARHCSRRLEACPGHSRSVAGSSRSRHLRRKPTCTRSITCLATVRRPAPDTANGFDWADTSGSMTLDSRLRTGVVGGRRLPLRINGLPVLGGRAAQELVIEPPRRAEVTRFVRDPIRAARPRALNHKRRHAPVFRTVRLTAPSARPSDTSRKSARRS